MPSNRRTFLRSIVMGAAAIVAAPLLKLVPSSPEPLPSLRFIQQFDVSSLPIVRMDILYGFATLKPDHSFRVQNGDFIA